MRWKLNSKDASIIHFMANLKLTPSDLISIHFLRRSHQLFLVNISRNVRVFGV